ncbi:fimbria/pilus outer membrane usher protein [Serratia proteamaculans]|uniref:fimbria/pilus outer membrane usher protein n=1 Tax=Serratia proteamaculans TaxID=28151 RepID=UPI0039B0E972
MNFHKLFGVKGRRGIFLSGLICAPVVVAGNIEFNTDVLDIQDRENLDLSQFSRAGYIMPGEYTLNVQVNGQSLSEQKITFSAAESADVLPQACLPEALVMQFGLKPSYLNDLAWTKDQCLILASLPGVEAKGDLGNSTLNIGIPQVYLEYISADWDPPARWDNGVTGLLLDYNVNANTSRDSHSGARHSLTGNGTLGANWAAWRLRADWQLQDLLAKNDYQSKGLEWSRYYMYRALPDWKARLTLGEDYLSSDIFDSFRFAGASLVSDISMLPPALRGYAPEVTGVAESNATVIVSQQGRVLYQTQVAAGPFNIQDLNSSVSGTLDVEIQEQNGQVKKYQVSTASLPYLTRPGAVRYKLAGGRPTNWQHNVEGPLFTAGEASWGVTNGWSLYGGAIGSDGYQALSLGIGRDLYLFGALSADITAARSTLPSQQQQQGKSLRISYAKMFEEYDSQVTFAGYRFSEKDFYSMSEYLSALKGYGYDLGNNKERYVVSFNKQFPDARISSYLNYTHQSYWNRPTAKNIDMTLSTYFDAMSLKNVSASLRGYRQSYYGRNDDGITLSLSVPWGNRGYLSYDSSLNRNHSNHSLGYSGRTDNEDAYSIRTGTDGHDADISGYYSRRGALADMSLSASSSTASRNSAGVSLNGGMTMTTQGAALHAGSGNGSTRLMIDTDGVGGVPLHGGSGGKTNQQGLAVMTGVSSYYRTQAGVNLEKLADDVEATQSMTQLTLTEGAIGYRKLGVVSGVKGLVIVRMKDGKAPPFAANVFTANGKNAGLIGDDGQAWLSGMQAGEKMQVRWNGAVQCEISLPDDLSVINETSLLLPCESIPGAGSADETN